MNADDFWATVLDPAQRTVYRISPDDKALELHHVLFGGPPEGRRDWMAAAAARIDTASLDLN